MRRSPEARSCIAAFALGLTLAAFPCACAPTGNGDGASRLPRRVAAPAPARYLPETSQIVRQIRHRGKASHEIWSVVTVARHRPQPEVVGPHDRPRPRIVRASGEQHVHSTNQRRLLDGANSDLSAISVGGCSVTNYNVGMTVGDQGVVVILDSGSGDLAVASTACGKSCEGIPNLWNTDQSGSTGRQGTLSYGSAQVVGDVFQESVTLPGEPAVSMNMVAITDQDGLLNPVPCLADADYSFDETGILGFGPDKSASENSQTIVGLLADQGVPEIFSTLLCQQGGLLWVGGYNPDAATSAPLYTPLDNTQGYYLFDINAIGLGGQNLNLDVSDIKWLADTGTNVLVVPQQVADNAASILNGPMEQLSGVSGFFYGNSQTCVTGFSREALDSALPALEFAIPDVNGNITVLSYPASVSYVEVQLFTNGSLLFCPNIRPGNAAENGGFNIYSNNLMNEFIVIWDQVNGQLGFADADTTLCNPASRGPASGPTSGLAPSQAYVPEGAVAPQYAFGPDIAFTPLGATAPQHAFAPQPGISIAPAGHRTTAPSASASSPSTSTSSPPASSSASSPDTTAATSPTAPAPASPTSSSPAPTPSSALAAWKTSQLWLLSLAVACVALAAQWI